MRTTQVATNIGTKDNANGICALLSTEGQKQVTNLLKQLSNELGDGIWEMPPSALHITLCEIMQAKPYPEDKEVSFQRNQQQYIQALKEALRDVKPIKIPFNRAEVSPQAIIIRGSDDDALKSIRERLVTSLPLPERTKQPPAIVHSSIARFTKELDLEFVESVVAKHNISFTETITEFQLMHNGWPHNLHYEIAARFQLKAE